MKKRRITCLLAIAAVAAIGARAASSLAQQQTRGPSEANTPSSTVVQAPAPTISEPAGSGKVQFRTAAQIQTAIYDANRQVAYYADQLSDLTNWETHIEIAISQLENTKATANSEIDERLKVVKSAAEKLAESASPTSDDVSRLQDALDDLEFRDLAYPLRWLTLKSPAALKTNVIETAGLYPERPSQKTVGPSAFLEVWDRVSQSSPADLKKSIADLVKKLDPETLHRWYAQEVDSVVTTLTDLKRKTANVRAQTEAAAKRTNSELLTLQQELIFGTAPQFDTVGLITEMMWLLFGLVFVSLLARLLAAWIFGGTNFAAIIEEKTLIEFGGMAFILLAIVTLGNSGKLEPQSIGTLLGTIAGYIFGKGIAAAGASAASESQKARARRVVPSVDRVTATDGGAVLEIDGKDLAVLARVSVSVTGKAAAVLNVTAVDPYEIDGRGYAEKLRVTMSVSVAGDSLRVEIVNPDGVVAVWAGKV